MNSKLKILFDLKFLLSSFFELIRFKYPYSSLNKKKNRNKEIVLNSNRFHIGLPSVGEFIHEWLWNSQFFPIRSIILLAIRRRIRHLTKYWIHANLSIRNRASYSSSCLKCLIGSGCLIGTPIFIHLKCHLYF